MIEIAVEITEVNESKTRDLGIEWPGVFSVNESSIPSVLEFGSFERKTAFLAALKNLEVNEAAKVLANPKLITKSGTRARFLVGGEVPFVVAPQTAKNSSALSPPALQWKEYGIIMEITPTVLKDGKIDIFIKTELSRLDYSFLSVGSYPAISKREALSHLQIKDGETMVLAGLIEMEKGETKTGVPFLSSIPVIGMLFGISKVKEIKKNVLIFITPKLMS